MRLSVTITASVKQVQLLNKMKLVIVLAAVALAEAAKLERVYLPPNARASAGSANFLQTLRHSLNGGFPKTAYSGTAIPNTYGKNTYSALESRPERAQAALERNAAILRQDNLNDGETFSYAYETENGIYAEESGVAMNGVQAQGGYTYTGDDGQVYSVRYTADENGFVPQGDHLPTPPPIPEAILKSIELNARAEASRAYQDGSYRDVNTSAGSNQQEYYNKNAQPFNYNDDSISISSARLRNGAGFNSKSLQKSYLPPFAQRNLNQRNGSYNARNGYRY